MTKMMLRILSIALLSAILSSCENYEETSVLAFQAANFEASGKAAESWANRDPDNPLPHFILAVSNYFNGDGAQTDNHRKRALGNGENISLISNWIDQLDLQAMPESRVHFLYGIQAEITGDLNAALENYTKALEIEPDEKLFLYNVDALNLDLDPKVGYSNPGDGNMSKNDGIRYQGEMKLASSAWVPVEGAFDVTAGTIRTGLGKSSFSGNTGGWVYVKNQETGDIVSWAPTVTDGMLLIASQSSPNQGPDSKSITIQADADYEHLPFDFQGRYRLIQIDKAKKHFFPVFHMDFYQVAGRPYASPKAYFGTELIVPRHQLLGDSNFRNGQTVIMCSSKRINSFASEVHLRGDFNIDEIATIKIPVVRKDESCGHKTSGGKMYYFGEEHFRLVVTSGVLFGTIRSEIRVP